jgi:hypothetical protein
MMGTLGWRQLMTAIFVKDCGGHSLPQAFSREALKKMLCFCKRESAALEKAQLYLNQRTRFVDYPIMRVIDIYFWQRGYETDRATPPSPRATF